MGFFSGKTDFKQIDSVVILEQTQRYKQESNLGFSFGATPGDGRVIAMGSKNVPAGTEYKFSVTYKNKEKKIVRAMSGTSLCDQLLQRAIDMDSFPTKTPPPSDASDYKRSVLLENQLPCGDYLIGRDIPSGTYDFSWVFGNGMIVKFTNAHDTTLGATTYFQYVGNRYDFEYRQCLHVSCKDGELLKIEGNVVVDISRSKEIKLAL